MKKKTTPIYFETGPKPVAWQYRVHHDDPNVDVWWDWHTCNENFYNTLKKENAPNIQIRALAVVEDKNA